jgi:hypothetical protein
MFISGLPFLQFAVWDGEEERKSLSARDQEQVSGLHDRFPRGSGKMWIDGLFIVDFQVGDVWH